MRAKQKNATAIRAFAGFLLLFFCALLSPAQEQGPAAAGDRWEAYGGDPGGLRFFQRFPNHAQECVTTQDRGGHFTPVPCSKKRN